MKGSSKTNPQPGDSRVSQVIFADSMQSQPSLRLSEILHRQRWVILGAMSLGLALSSLYWTKARVWYESTSKILVSQRDPALASSERSSTQTQDMVDEDVLANHMEVMRSRKIVEGALLRQHLTDLPSIKEQIHDENEDSADYVIEHLKLSRGGEGTAKDARSLSIRFEHTNADDCRLVLEAIVVEYQLFLSEQLTIAMSEANSLVKDARNSLEKELENVQQEYITARQNAPVLFQGDGSSNLYLEQYRRLHEELLTLEMKESSSKSRLEKAKAVFTQKKQGEKIEINDLGIIDTDSLSRLGIFAGMQANAGRSTPFLQDQPARIEQQQTISDLLIKEAELGVLKADLGQKHPDVRKLEEQIKFIAQRIEERDKLLKPESEDVQLTPDGLLRAYVAFLDSDITAINERRNELALLKDDAEKQARSLVEFELKEGIMKSRVDRTQLLFDGLVEQLRGLDLAAGMQGYIHELLEKPRKGEQIWPSLSLCAFAGIMMGMVAGLVVSVMIDQLDTRFRTSSEIDSAIGLPILTRVGNFKTEGDFPIVLDSSPEGESFRILRTLLLNDIRSGQLRIMSATSPLPGDGKTTILANIAASFAKLNMTVVLIEGDMRRPTFCKRFNVPDSGGLSEVLRGKISIDDALVPSGVPNLTIMTSGAATVDPSELLQNETFDQMLQDLKERFQLVIVDVGPVLAVSDPVIVAQKSDGMLLVVRSSNDTRKQVIDAVETLRSANAKMLGCIVNTYGSGAEFERRGYYGYYYSSDRNPKPSDAAPRTKNVRS
jgi:succinoglycan biosynthesis transport protein ExoP